MPRIPTTVLNCAFYLYPSRSAAERGEDVGGTGFIALREMDWKAGKGPVTYGVTNYHVAVSHGCSVVRLNTLKGPPEIIELDPSEWAFIPNGDDVAAVELPTNPAMHAVNSIATALFATEDRVRRDHIGPAEDLFMIGRFVNHDGGAMNQPAVRFGNISVMPAPILQPNEHVGDCYVVDMHSRSGFSGSPVFAYRTFGQDLASDGTERTSTRVFGQNLRVEYRPVFVLLGIHCAQFPEPWQIKQGQQETTGRSDEARLPEGDYIEGFSGMTVVIPAWRILELLELPRFEPARDRAYAELIRQNPQLATLYQPKAEGT